MDKEETRLFFAVDSEENNPEIFETLESAKLWQKVEGGKIWIAIVKNAYKEEGLNAWNYEDFSDTFTFVKYMED
jgi:hypothetical protein